MGGRREREGRTIGSREKSDEYTYRESVPRFSLKRSTAGGVKPANKVGAVNYKEPVTYKRTVVRSYTRYIFIP